MHSLFSEFKHFFRGNKIKKKTFEIIDSIGFMFKMYLSPVATQGENYLFMQT